jgi:hypothetical protein
MEKLTALPRHPLLACTRYSAAWEEIRKMRELRDRIISGRSKSTKAKEKKMAGILTNIDAQLIRSIGV